MANKAALAIGLAIASFALADAGPANAIAAAPDKVYDFSGYCTLDCAGDTAKAALTLSPSYTLGQTISSSNFISFVYDGQQRWDRSR